MRTVGNVKDAKVLVEQWRLDYNRYRPYSSLGDMSPAMFVAMRLGSGSYRFYLCPCSRQQFYLRS